MSDLLSLRALPFSALLPSSRFATATLLDDVHPDRREVEAFIAAIYRQRYGATLRSYLPTLLAFRDASGGLQAAVGLRRASEGPLFVEQYLVGSAEQVVATRTAGSVSRGQLVEVGNFAARSAGDAREMIVHLTGLLHAEGLRWVLFAATRQLRNAFHRLHLQALELADARSEDLRGDHDDWGSYYAAQPKVMMGDIAAAHAFLARGADNAQRPAMPVGLCLAFAT